MGESTSSFTVKEAPIENANGAAKGKETLEVMLNRARSSTPQRSRSSSTTTLRRTFSMRGSTSVKDGKYRSIEYDIARNDKEKIAIDREHDKDHGQEEEDYQDMSKKKMGKFKKACKKLFGL